MITFPNAKINIGLNILYKREDGFHEIDSIFYPIYTLKDVLEIVKSDRFSFTSSGLSVPGSSDDNLCVKAFELIKDRYNIPNVSIHLHKVIPMGAGLGGGSADGAFVINMLDELFGLNIPAEERAAFAAKLGSDCPFFIGNVVAHASGRGEVLNDINVSLSSKYIALINPGIHIGTKEAYAGVIPTLRDSSVDKLILNPPNTWKGNLSNDFEESVFPNYEILSEIKTDLYNKGALYASMTGSGSTLYGIFDCEPNLCDFPQDYFVWSGKL